MTMALFTATHGEWAGDQDWLIPATVAPPFKPKALSDGCELKWAFPSCSVESLQLIAYLPVQSHVEIRAYSTILRVTEEELCAGSPLGGLPQAFRDRCDAMGMRSLEYSFVTSISRIRRVASYPSRSGI
jgi:hypothetical protein